MNPSNSGGGDSVSGGEVAAIVLVFVLFVAITVGVAVWVYNNY